MQNTDFLHFTKAFSLGCVCTPYMERARYCLRDLSDRAQPEETKGISLTSAIESSLASVYKRSFIGGT